MGSVSQVCLNLRSWWAFAWLDKALVLSNHNQRHLLAWRIPLIVSPPSSPLCLSPSFPLSALPPSLSFLPHSLPVHPLLHPLPPSFWKGCAPFPLRQGTNRMITVSRALGSSTLLHLNHARGTFGQHLTRARSSELTNSRSVPKYRRIGGDTSIPQ